MSCRALGFGHLAVGFYRVSGQFRVYGTVEDINPALPIIRSILKFPIV